MYQFSGAKILSQFLFAVCETGNVSSFLKLEAAKSLLAFEEETEGSDREDEDSEDSDKENKLNLS